MQHRPDLVSVPGLLSRAAAYCRRRRLRAATLQGRADPMPAHNSTAPLPTYDTNTGWRRIQSLLPESLRVDPSRAPTEEWLSVGAFSMHLDCWRRPDALATLVVVHGAGATAVSSRL